MRSRSIVSLFALLVFIFTSAAVAQTFRGSIQGTVTDSSGAAVAGAQVKVFSPDTGLSRTITTNDVGRVLGLGTAAWRLQRNRRKGRLPHHDARPCSSQRGSAARADVKLTAGAVQEVSKSPPRCRWWRRPPILRAARIEASEAADLPVNGRDYTKLVELVPGATSDPVGSTESAGSYGLFSLNGNRGRSNNYLLDGTDMNDGYRNLPSVNQAGVWGCPRHHSSRRRAGRNSCHRQPRSGVRPQLRRHGQHRDQERHQSNPRQRLRVLPQRRARRAQLLQYRRSAQELLHQPSVRRRRRADPSSRTHVLVPLLRRPARKRRPAATRHVSTGSTDIERLWRTLNPVIQSLLSKLHPWGDDLALHSPGSVTFTTPFLNNSDNVIAKADQHLHLFSPGDLFTGRYFYSHGIQSFPLGMLYTGSSAPGYNTTTPTHVNIASLSYTSIPRPNLIVEVRGGYNRFLQQFLPEDIGLNPETAFGLNTLPPDYSPHDLGLPTIKLALCSTVNEDGDPNYPDVGACSPIGATDSDARGRIDTNYQLFGNVSLVKGKAQLQDRLRVAAHLHQQLYQLRPSRQAVIRHPQRLPGRDYRWRQFYRWRRHPLLVPERQRRLSPGLLAILNKLTLNYGLRWDYFGVDRRQEQRLQPLQRDNGGTVNPLGASGDAISLYPRDWLNFAPRFSLADDLLGNGKLVVRTSVGIYYDGASQDFFVGNQPTTPMPASAGPAFNYIGFASPVVHEQSNPAVLPSLAIARNYSPNSALHRRPEAEDAAILLLQPQHRVAAHAKKIAIQIGYVGSQGRHLFRFRDLNQFNNVRGSTDKLRQRRDHQLRRAVLPHSVGAYADTPLLPQPDRNQLAFQLQLPADDTEAAELARPDLHSELHLGALYRYEPATARTLFPTPPCPTTASIPMASAPAPTSMCASACSGTGPTTLPRRASRPAGLLNGWAARRHVQLCHRPALHRSVTSMKATTTAAANTLAGSIIDRQSEPGHGRRQPAEPLLPSPRLARSTPTGTASDGIPAARAATPSIPPNYTNFDFSLTKTTHLSEKLAMELRADFFNIFNHPNLCNPLMPGFGLDAFTFGSRHSGRQSLGDGHQARSLYKPRPRPTWAPATPTWAAAVRAACS